MSVGDPPSSNPADSLVPAQSADSSDQSELTRPDSDELEEALPDVEVLLSRVEKDPAARHLVMSMFHRGPLPHPWTLAGYGDIDPSYPERIVGLAEREAAERQSLTRMDLEAQIASQKRAQWMAFILASVLIGGALMLFFVKSPPWAFGIIVASLVSLVSVFLVKTLKKPLEQPQIPSRPSKPEEDD